MDPAGPGFSSMENKEWKLNSDDAQYVQCIHTDGNKFGLMTKYECGHANFLMNNGNDQVGCEIDLTCDHERAYEYFQESLYPDHQFWGIPCNAISNIPYKNETIDMIGIHSHRTKGTFCVPTKSTSPYALDKDTVVKTFWDAMKSKSFFG